MSLIDKLLQVDAKKITELPRKTYEVKRLSGVLKTKFELELSAISSKRYAEIQKIGVDIGKKGNVRDVDIYSMQMFTLLDGIKAPDFRDKRLLEHFNSVTPKELIAKLFLSGEISDIYNEINELSGYEKDEDEADEEIKN
jgi:hypothetical protein